MKQAMMSENAENIQEALEDFAELYGFPKTRRSEWHSRGPGFDSPWLHHKEQGLS